MPGTTIWNAILGCRHRQLSRPFTSSNETYKVCLQCGTRLRYSLETMSLIREPKKKTPNLLAGIIGAARKLLSALSRRTIAL